MDFCQRGPKNIETHALGLSTSQTTIPSPTKCSYNQPLRVWPPWCWWYLASNRKLLVCNVFLILQSHQHQLNMNGSGNNVLLTCAGLKLRPSTYRSGPGLYSDTLLKLQVSRKLPKWWATSNWPVQWNGRTPQWAVPSRVPVSYQNYYKL